MLIQIVNLTSPGMGAAQGQHKGQVGLDTDEMAAAVRATYLAQVLQVRHTPIYLRH
jgi:hypothetical protein